MTQELNGFLSVSVGLMVKAEKTLKVNLYCMVGETDILEATLEGNSHITLCWFIEIYAENLILPPTARKNGSSRSQSCNAFGSTNQLALHHVSIQI